MKPYDIIIIGSGLGGLACGAMLSREGMNVCVLERHSLVGGCLQSFRRGGHLFDTGMHYVGSMAPGQILHQYFRYFGVLDQLHTHPLLEDGFDIVQFDGKQYAYANGYARFAARLAEYFPSERAGIERYCSLLQAVGQTISPDILRTGRLSAHGEQYMGQSAVEAIASCTTNPILQNVLAGTTLLHSRDQFRTSLYEHAIIQHSFIESAARFTQGSQHVADALVEQIRQQGGVVRTAAEVTRLCVEQRSIAYVEVNHTEQLQARHIISDIHPAHLYSLMSGAEGIRPALFRHIQTLPNTWGIFTTYLQMKPDTFPYLRRNYYFHQPGVGGWTTHADYRGCNLPVVMMSMQAAPNKQYADIISLMFPIDPEELSPWLTTTPHHRGEEYAAWKKRYAEASIDFVAQTFPTLRGSIEQIYTASPLTYRDYTATPMGSAYGIVKDYHNPLLTHLPVRTKISNLLLTGQNVNVHGCLGVCVSAAATCSTLLGESYLAKKIAYA